MTAQQELAIANHCRLAGEACHIRFGHALPSGVTLMVTVNSGYE